MLQVEPQVHKLSIFFSRGTACPTQLGWVVCLYKGFHRLPSFGRFAPDTERTRSLVDTPVQTELLTWMETQTAMIWEMNKTVESEPIG